MAVTVGMSGRPTTIHDEFDVLSLDRPQVDALISEMNRALKDTGEERRNIILAALAELSARYLNRTSGDNMDDVTANREGWNMAGEERHVWDCPEGATAPPSRSI